MKKALLILLIVVAGFFLFRLVFSGQVVLPQTFALGALSIHYYGVAIAFAVLAAYRLATLRAEQYGLSSEDVDKLLVVVVICGFIGARLYHVLSQFDYYRYHLVQILAVWQGGLSIFGVLAGGVLGLLLARRWWLPQYRLRSLLDWLAPSLALGQLIGRLGNFFNYEIFGYPTNLPWKMFVPQNFRPLAYLTDSFFHPLFLYEILWNGIILLILFKVGGKRHKTGTLFLTYLFLYNAGRFFLEFLRVDSVFIGTLRLNSLVSAALAVGALGTLFYFQYASTPTSHS